MWGQPIGGGGDRGDGVGGGSSGVRVENKGLATGFLSLFFERDDTKSEDVPSGKDLSLCFFNPPPN